MKNILLKLMFNTLKNQLDIDLPFLPERNKV